MSQAPSAYASLIAEIKDISLLSSIAGLVGWDQHTYMPPGGSALRADQVSMMARMIHQRMTSPKIGDWLSELEASALDDDAKVNVRETRRTYDRRVKLPDALVQEEARVSVQAQNAWEQARRNSDFSAFAPWLEKTISLKLQRASCLGYSEHPYDALLDDFEPGETTGNLSRVFESLRDPLVELIGRIKGSKNPTDGKLLSRRFPVPAQQVFAREAAEAVGFDFNSGRLDVSVHPFCSGIGPGDTRMTTRYDEHHFNDAFFGVLHETGHGLYNQGLKADLAGTPLGAYVSLGIHESQSRMWENLVGRGRSFWKLMFPRAKQLFPEALADVDGERWYRAVNDVRPSFIRVEADETTYNLHILLRFELEQALISQGLSVADLPGAWDEKMQKYLGIKPADAAHGVLQDIHWSGGMIGYFPTYTLGNLYACQFFDAAKTELGDLEAQFAVGEFKPLLGWLRKNIHQQGRRYSAGNLVKVVTGKPLSAEPLLTHLRKKAEEIYGV